MAFDFPNSPTVGQTFQGYTWDGEKWVSTPGGPNIGGVIRILVFTASGTYVPSANMTTAVLECQGGGGGGGGSIGTAGYYTGGGGGGGGAYARKFATAAQIGASQAVTVGAGGGGGSGGPSSVGLLCAAVGGSVGANGTSGAIGSGGAGGPAASCVGDFAVSGGNGFGGFYSSSVTNQLNYAGYGGGSFFGASSAGVVASNTAKADGSPGVVYGGGGGGGASNNAALNGIAASGAFGLVVITEYGITSLGSSATQAGAVRYDLPQGLATTQQLQARQNISAPLRGWLAGLIMSTPGASANFTVQPGEAADSTNSVLMTLPAAITKNMGAWAAGSGNGALDTGVMAANAFDVYLIRRPDTGVVDVLLTIMGNAPTLPANYTQFRRIGLLWNNNGTQWLKFVQTGDEFLWDAPAADLNGNAVGTAGIVAGAVAPPNCEAILAAAMISNTAGTYALIHSLVANAAAVAAGTAGNYQFYTAVANFASPASSIRVRLNAARQYRIVSNATSATCQFYVTTLGYIDRRGRDN